MKLKNEIETMTKNIKDIIDNLGREKIQDYKEVLKNNPNIKNADIALIWELGHMNKNGLIYLYDKYNCDDTHIETLLIHCCKKLNII